MTSTTDDRFVPPAPVGTPYRSDPADPAPFLNASDSVPVVPVEAAPYIEPTGLPQHAEDAPRTEYGAPPMFQPPGKSAIQGPPVPLTDDQRFARNAFWFGIASLFLFQVVMGPVAIVLGIMSRRRGELEMGKRTIILGLVAIAIGVLSIVLTVLGVIPPANELWDKIRNPK
jgi:hypothetical protein